MAWTRNAIVGALPAAPQGSRNKEKADSRPRVSGNKVKILVVSMSDPKTDSRNLKLVQALKAHNHNVDRMWLPMSGGGKFGGAKTFRLLLLLPRSLQHAIRVKGYDVIHLLDGWDIGLLPYLLNRTPKVFDFRSDWTYMIARRYQKGLKDKLAEFVSRHITTALVRHTDHVTTVDPRLAQTMLQHKPKRWSWLRNRPLQKMFEGVEFKKEDGFIDIGYVGKIAIQRNVHSVIEAMRGLETTPLRFWIAGSYESNETYWNQAIKPYVDNKKIFYLGHVPFTKIAAVYRSFDFNMIPAIGDHWTVKLGESIASKVPIIIREGKLHRKLLGDAAVYYHGGDPHQEVEGIRKALKEAVAKHDVLKQRARELTITSWEDEVRHLEHIYQSISRNH